MEVRRCSIRSCLEKAGRLAKRYVLLLAGGDLSEGELKELGRILEQRHGKLKLIQVQGNRRAVIVKTTNIVAPVFREQGGRMTIGGKELVAVLTSGAIGKLKKRASWSETQGHGQVPER